MVMANRRITPHRFSSDLRLTYALPWYVHVPQKLRHIVGKSRAKFASKKAASSFAKDLEKKRAMIEHRRQLAAISREFEGCRDFKLVTEAATEVKRQEMPVLTLTDAFAQVVASKKQSGKRSNSVSTLACALKSFAQACQKPAGEVVAADIETWLYAGDYTPQTRKGRHTALSTAFNWLVKRKLVAGNPVAAVDAPSVPYKRPEILTVDEIEKILRACEQHDPALIGHVAMILFGGLRRGESARTLKDDVVGSKIQLDGSQTKLKKPRDVVVTETLSAWLAVPGVELGGKHLFQRMKKIRELAGVEIPQNALRHSAASYARELMGAIESARLLGHSETIAAKSYVANVTHSDAERFIALRPSTNNLTPTP
jgi:integrase